MNAEQYALIYWRACKAAVFSKEPAVRAVATQTVRDIAARAPDPVGRAAARRWIQLVGGAAHA